MKKHRNDRRKPGRLERIERKCDTILGKLDYIQAHATACNPVDDAIERMHDASRRMRDEAEREARILRKVFHIK